VLRAPPGLSTVHPGAPQGLQHSGPTARYGSPHLNCPDARRHGQGVLDDGRVRCGDSLSRSRLDDRNGFGIIVINSSVSATPTSGDDDEHEVHHGVAPELGGRLSSGRTIERPSRNAIGTTPLARIIITIIGPSDDDGRRTAASRRNCATAKRIGRLLNKNSVVVLCFLPIFIFSITTHNFSMYTLFTLPYGDRWDAVVLLPRTGCL
jgi:hypothetical protein